MKALSIRQPWAWLILHGYPIFEAVDNGDGSQRVVFSGKRFMKNVENRDWYTPYRGRIYVHAANKQDNFDVCFAFLCGKLKLAPGPVLTLFGKDIPKGAIVGEVDIVDCVTSHPSPWFEGRYGLVLARPIPYTRPIPYKGKVGLFEVVLP